MTAVEVDYLACDLKTGIVVEELPSLVPSGPLERRLGSSVTVSADLAIDGAPKDWINATTPGRSLVIAMDRTSKLPLWGGIVLTRDRGSAPTSTLGMATPEAYLDRRYTGSYDASGGADQAAIMTGVAQALLVDAPPFVIDAPTLGVSGTYSVLDSDDRTVLSVLQEIQQQDGWPEWTIDLAWTDTTRSAVQMMLRIRKQIGIVRADPEATFDFPGSVASYTQSESYEAGKGATSVLANGEGEGSGRLHSNVYTATDLIAAGWPSWVYRFTPATGVTDPTSLNAFAQQALTQQRTGSSAWTITAAATTAPRLGTDWALGDSVRLNVAAGVSPGHPAGTDVVARAYGWQLDTPNNTISPLLIEDDTE